MAYTAITSDPEGRLYWIDHEGVLQRSAEGDLDGEPQVLGGGWDGVEEFAVTQQEGAMTLLARRYDNRYVSLDGDGLPALASWRTDGAPSQAARALVLRSIGGLAGGTFVGVDGRSRLLEVRATALATGAPLAALQPHLSVVRAIGSSTRSSQCHIVAGRRVFTVNCRGQLCYLSRRVNARPGRRGHWVVLESGWSAFQRVCAAGSSALYAFRSEGDVLLYAFEDDGKSVRLMRPEVVATGLVGWQGLPCDVEGYATPLSVDPGRRVKVHLATRLSPPAVGCAMDCTVDFVRLRRLKQGRIGDFDMPVGPTPRRIVAQPRGVPEDWLMNGAGWQPALSATMDRILPSGIYAARCTDASRRRFYVPFVVRPGTKRNDFAVIANTNTWNAYNSWGGWGKYVKRYPLPFTLPFERPHPGLHPEAPDCCRSELRSQTSHLLRAELWVLGWLDDHSDEFGYDVYSDQDLHEDRLGLCSARKAHRYRALILNTHPEYWTRRMYTNVLGYLHAGGSILYLGANGMYEEVEFASDARTLRVFPGVDPKKNPLAKHGELRRQCLARVRCMPERALTGVGFEQDASPTVKGQPYQLALPPAESPALEGVRLRVGDEFGMRSANPGFAANGWEVDRRGEHTPLPARDRKALVALGSCAPSSGEMLFYESGYGGVVYAASSLSFGGSLAVDPTLQRIVLNVLRIARAR